LNKGESEARDEDRMRGKKRTWRYLVENE